MEFPKQPNYGEKYHYAESEGISEKAPEFPPKVPIKLWLTFGKGKTEKPVTTITFFSRLYLSGTAHIDVVIRDIPVK